MDKEKTAGILGFKAAIGIAGLVGLLGGILFSIWDSATVIFEHAPLPVAFREVFFLALYSVSLYAVIGCVGMVAVGIVMAYLIRAGRYSIKKSRLAGILIGVFVLLATYALLGRNVMSGTVTDIIEITLICIFSGVGFGSLSIYVLDKGIRRERLIAIGVSLLVWLLALLYGGLWVNLGLLPEEAFFKPASLLADLALLVLVSFLAAGLYILSLSILLRYNPQRTRQAGYVSLGVIICVFITISFVGPFSLGNTTEAGTSFASENGTLVNSGNLKGKPNILWIVMDTVRADHLSCYGYQRNTTPNIDRMASEGILFENAISAAPWTLPSHASMFTGMFPSKHGADAEHYWLEDGFQTVAEVLRLHGYRTFGYSNNPVVSRRKNLSQGFDTFEFTDWGRRMESSALADLLWINTTKRYIEDNYLLIDDGARRTNKIVESWIAEANQTEAPFFVFINYVEAHDPYHPPAPYAAPYLGEGMSLAKAMKVNQDEAAYMSGKVEMSEEDFNILLSLYDGEISYLDFRMGKLFDYLRELEILDETMVIITSDHGENFGEHQMMEHVLCVYDTLLHVPLIIRYPECFKAGLRVDRQVRLTDIYPTILDVLAIEYDSYEIQGCSLLSNREDHWSDFAIAEHAVWGWWLDKLKRANHKFDVSKYARRLKTIRTEEFKYIWASDGCHELYNIRQDPEELNNLIETNPEKARELGVLLAEWLNSFETYRPESAQEVP